MTPTDALDESTLSEFVDAFHGEVILPEDDGYEDARTVWNGRIDREPALICRCTGTADVIHAVNVARDGNLPVAIRSTGHNVAGAAVCEGGLVIDVGPMNGVRVDPDAKTARVQSGVTWGEFDRETQAFGLATPGAQAPSVGVVGAALGGGIGWLSRKYGLTVDNVLSADLVTAEGELVHASRDENPELFWALRGGGAPGVVTSLELSLHDVGSPVLAGSLFYPIEEASRVIRGYRDFMTDAPNEVTALTSIRAVPSAPHVPAERRGTRGVMIGVCYAGDLDSGESVLAPLRRLGDPYVDSIRRRPYTAWQRAGASNEVARTSQRSLFLEHLSDAAIDTFVERATAVPSPRATAYFISHDGAVSEVPSDTTAYPHRDASQLLVVEARWDDPDEDPRHTAWVREYVESMKPHTTGKTWVNAHSEIDDADRIEAAYGDKFDRLRRIRNAWDPDGFFGLP